jgi:hypothetical protein
MENNADAIEALDCERDIEELAPQDLEALSGGPVSEGN